MALTIKAGFMIVGEGKRDKAFFEHLCKVHGIDSFQIEGGTGIDRFGEYFEGLVSVTGFDNLRMLVVVADNDADAGKNLRKVQTALRAIKLPAPEEPLHWVKRTDSPKVTIVNMPFDGTCANLGCLETLVLSAMRDQYREQADCADQLSKCIGVDQWRTHSSRDKFVLRSILSSIWEENPNCGITECLDKGLIPLQHAVFSPLVRLLRALPKWADSEIKSWAEWAQSNPEDQPK